MAGRYSRAMLRLETPTCDLVGAASELLAQPHGPWPVAVAEARMDLLALLPEVQRRGQRLNRAIGRWAAERPSAA